MTETVHVIPDELLDVIVERTNKVLETAQSIDEIRKLANEYISLCKVHDDAAQVLKDAEKALTDKRAEYKSAPDVAYALQLIADNKADIKDWKDNKSQMASLAHEEDIILNAIETSLKPYAKAVRTARFEERRAYEVMMGAKEQAKAFIAIYGYNKSDTH